MSNFSPYQSPSSAAGQLPTSTHPVRTPTVFYWYVAYCIGLALLYAACVIAGVVLMVGAAEFGDTAEDRIALLILGAVLTVLCLPLAIMFIAAPLLPRRKWAWIYGIVLIVIGLTSGCTMIPCVILLVFWLQDPARRYFES